MMPNVCTKPRSRGALPALAAKSGLATCVPVERWMTTGLFRPSTSTGRFCRPKSLSDKPRWQDRRGRRGPARPCHRRLAPDFRSKFRFCPRTLRAPSPAPLRRAALERTLHRFPEFPTWAHLNRNPFATQASRPLQAALAAVT
jgi:hypothetical protein